MDLRTLPDCEPVVGVLIRPSLEADVSYMGGRLRTADEREAMALTGLPPWEALRMALERSDETLTVTRDSRPAMMFGRAYVEGLEGMMVWLVATREFSAVWRPFLRESREWLRYLMADYAYAYNWVDQRNTVHVRWLTWLGAEWDLEHEINGVTFRRFTLENPCAYQKSASGLG